MAAETDVQFFSHLNTGCPQLTNDWGCMINLLDACLVNGVSLPTVSSVSVATGGNITVNFAAAHSVLLFQCVTLAGFTPSALNGKYRVIGVPTTTQLTLSSDLSAQSATTIGTAKISPLGYQIAYSANTKRVYRALNPTANHPYIRVDESLSSADGKKGIYTSTYAKYAMVGLLESIDDIDDVNDPNVLQLPFDTTDPDKNWTISGKGTSVVRGWSKWYWARYADAYSENADTTPPNSGSREFTLFGGVDAFYLATTMTSTDTYKVLHGCGLYESSLASDVVPNWFLMSILGTTTATAYDFSSASSGGPFGGMPITGAESTNKLFVPKYNVAKPISSNDTAYSITPDYFSGYSKLYSAMNISALEIPIYDATKYLRGSLKHIYYAGNKQSTTVTTPLLADTSMYVWDTVVCSSGQGGFYVYLGEMS